MPWWNLGLLAVALLQTNVQGQFVATGREISTEVGQAVALNCMLTSSVDECQWSWQSLSEPTNEAIVVKQYSSVGQGSRDCGVQFVSVLKEQEGIWRCGARNSTDALFLYDTPIKLTIHQSITFVEVSELVEGKLEKPALLVCKTAIPIFECKWSWRSGKISTEANIDVKQFVRNNSNSQDCSINIDSVLPEQEGLWICGARNVEDSEFTLATETNLTISKGVEFVQLSQGIQVNVGEPVLLRCVVSLPVAWCQWSWQPLGHSEATPTIVKGFSPANDQHRDCSVRFESVLEEQEGLWSCSVRHTAKDPFSSAPPATLTLLPAVRIRFLKTPQDTRIALGASVLLRCVAASSVSDCHWMWRPLNEPNATAMLVMKFASFGNYSRDCSVHFSSVQSAQEGLWGCTIHGGTLEAQLQAETPLAKLTIYEPVPVQFVELSREIQIPHGQLLSLRCVASSPVEQCQWFWKSFNDTNTNSTAQVVRAFLSSGNHSEDCSLRIKSVSEEHEGIWICGAQRKGQNEITLASPARVALLKPESVMVALWAAPEKKVTLACRLSSLQSNTTCYWHHPPHTIISENNHTQWHYVQQNNNTGICTLVLDPKPKDLGQWKCVFSMATNDGEWEIAAASLFLLETDPQPEKSMGWLVGVLAAIVLILTVLLIGILVCKCRSKSPSNKNEIGNPKLPGKEDQKIQTRYTEPPTKINFQFGEPPAVLRPHSPKTNHIYEQVDHFVSPNTSKHTYVNVQ